MIFNHKSVLLNETVDSLCVKPQGIYVDGTLGGGGHARDVYKRPGYYPMVYANAYWIANKIDMSKISYDIWVAKYQQKYTYSKTSMWQASNTGSVKGVNGNVDIDYLYKDYTQIIPGNTWRTIAGNRYYYQNHVMQKAAWINDGQNWYYMNAAGNPSTGWLELSGKKYYLEADGHMTVSYTHLFGKETS